MNTLTIILPTYKRASHLKTALARLESELKYESKASAVVVLDPSGDGSEAVLRQFNVPWICNPSRIGFNESVIRGLGHASGEYVWIVGDDDIMHEGAVSTLIRRLNEWKPGMLISQHAEGSFKPFPCGVYSSFRLYVTCAMSAHPPMLVEDLHLAARVFRKELFMVDTARIYGHTLFGHCYAVADGIEASNQPVDVFSGKLFSLLPQSVRPLWHDFPEDIDRTLTDYIHFLGLSSGVCINADLALKPNRDEFKKSIRNPIRFVMDHWRAILSLPAWRYAIARMKTNENR